MASPFLQEIFCHVEKIDSSKTFVPVYYGDASHRPTWGKSHWEGTQLNLGLTAAKRELKSIVERQAFDAFIISSYSHKICWFAKTLARKMGIPFIVGPMERPSPASFRWTWVRSKIIQRFLKDAAGIAVMGKRAHDDFGSVYQGLIADVPYSFDLSGMLAKPTYRESGPADRPMRFLFSGRLVPFRDPMFAVRAFHAAKLATTIPIELAISGRGELEGEITSYIAKHHLESSVVYLNDFKDWYDLRNLYTFADVLLSLGRYSTWNLPIQEAMAAGLGIVATHTTEAANSLIIDQHNGFLVHHPDINAAKNAILRYVNDPTLVTTHSHRNREIVKLVDVVNVAPSMNRLLDHCKASVR